ncbi:MAG: glycosyltransferase family 2 protein [Chloroflexi bacterium]|jgi:glycosyltransferase involved in cell wall biosynthesis|nr:glycosyltransferase family 2 protein [Chloroflexota bacterium]
MTISSLGLFFPMYNERKSIEKFIGHIEQEVSQIGIDDYEILLVDDGSRDGCDQIVAEWAQRNPHVRMVQHEQNQGYGAALRTGFLESRKAVVFYTDTDLPADIADLERALPLMAEADLVIGYRVERHETLRRAIYSRIYNFLMRLFFDVHVRDVNFSFKVVRREVLDKIQLTATSVFIDGQLLAEARRYGFAIAEIPIEYTPREFGVSNFDSFQAAWSTLTEMVIYLLKKSQKP